MGDKAKLTGSKTCQLCNKCVVDAVFCKGCSSPYHPGCAIRTGLLPNGAYSKCCRPKSPVGMSQSDLNVLVPSLDTTTSQNMTNDSVSLIINKAINGLQIGLTKNFSSLSSAINDLSTKVDAVTSRLDEVITTVSDHSIRIKAIEGTLHDINTNSITGNCMTEIHDRLSRSCNLILFGLADDIDDNSNGHLRDETRNTILQLFSQFSSSGLFENSKLYRIGTFAQAQRHPRPVKIVCNSVDKARELHMSFLLAKKDNTYRPILQNLRLSRDLTKLQMEEMAELKKDLLIRHQTGDVGARIIHRNGVPSIVSAPRRQKTTSLVSQ